jgi:tetrahydromethanopterin S-methyltransferase subunit G
MALKDTMYNAVVAAVRQVINEDVNERLDKLDGKIDTVRAELMDRMNQSDKRLDKIDVRLERYDDKFERIADKLHQHDEKFLEIEGQLQKVLRNLEGESRIYHQLMIMMESKNTRDNQQELPL